MHAYRITDPAGPESLEKIDLDTPTPGAGEVLLDLKAWSLNFRDLIVSKGGYPGNDNFPVQPLSDAAGVVGAVGENVNQWKPGDRVMPNFMRDWVGGDITPAHQASAFGGAIDGLLAEKVALPASCLVKMPADYSFAEAATLPCAAVTAWNGLVGAGVTAGDTVLLLGTGGVSVFGLQLAKAMGCTTIITSSSDAKLEKCKALGADHVVNYATTPEWHEPARAITGGRGADAVLEVGGAGTLERSLQAVRVGGHLALIGLLANPDEQPTMLPLL
ncbi:MAG: NAD(P)-dependent alcohol dehydrogenase, partial [Planctomycetota bacterium]